MKKLNLDETWRLCLQMWKWIAKQVELGKVKVVDVKSIYALKKRWLKGRGFGVIYDNCFFCKFDNEFTPLGEECKGCPARLVEPRFSKFWCEKKYHWFKDPIGFYNRLVALNKKRLARKK